MRGNDAIGDPPYKCQIHGVLSKKPFGHQSNKWSKRFFMILDGFLLYYTENERKDFEKKKLLNIHPKGCIPLGSCSVASTSEPNQPFCIHIRSEAINGDFVVAADSDYERERWVNLLRQSSRITWSNAQLGDDLIQQLEVQGLKMAQERQDYFDKLQYEVSALHDEKIRTEELEKLNDELQKERTKMETFASELKEEYDKIKMELDSTVDAMSAIAEDKLELNKQTEDLQQTLEALDVEKKKTLHLLEDSATEKEKLSKERQNLTAASSQLQQRLAEIETRSQQFRDEKALIQTRLAEAEQKAGQLAEDKVAMMEHADELKASIKDLASQKAITEAELKEEIVARLEAERRLREAEESLMRLERAVQEQGTEGRGADEIHDEMVSDVRTLKRFFENVIFESKLDADKPVMIKNAIHARKKMVRRAKTMRFEASKQRRSRGALDSLSSVASPVSPCEAMPYPTFPDAEPPSPTPRLAQSQVITASDLEGLPWARHSVIGQMAVTSITEASDEV